MKVRITNESKEFIVLAEAPAAHAIIRDMKEDLYSGKEYAEMAVNCIGQALGMCYNWCDKVLGADAEIAKNNRVWNAFNKNSRYLDVWINFTARTDEGFLEGGAYLTDIWNIGGADPEELAGHMYYRRFQEVK